MENRKIEGKHKLNLTMKITDSVIRLSTVVIGYSDNGAKETVKKFNKWAKDTQNILSRDFGPEKATRFGKLKKPSIWKHSPDDLDRFSREHANYLQELIEEI